MIALLLSFVLALQGIPVQAQQAGTVSGVLKDAVGRPVAGIRMAAIARPQSLDEAVTSAAMSSLAETDEQGRYTLESIPPGRYYIAAGRLDAQTYYPGTSDMAMAKEVAITPGAVVSGIDFRLDDSSFGRAGPSGSATTSLTLPLRVTVEGGGKMPLSAGGKFTSVKLDMGSSVITTPIANTFVSVPGPQTTAYRVTVENLPETYAVKSITYGTTDLLTNTLRLTPANFPSSAPGLVQFVNIAPPASVSAPTTAGPSTPNQPPVAQLAQDMQRELELQSYLNALAVARGVVPPQPAPATAAPVTVPTTGPAQVYQFGALPQDPAALLAYLTGMATALARQNPGTAIRIQGNAPVAQGGGTIISLSAPQPAATPPSQLSITLVSLSPNAASGVRVSGRMNVKGSRIVYLSGIPGTVYSDGTFEVNGVPPGRHSIVTRDSGAGVSPLAASVVVENSNLEGIVLTETAVLPMKAWEPTPPRPAGGHPPGYVPLARLTGTLLEEGSKQPIPEGTVVLKTNGYYSASFPVDADGHFELPPLLPGTYDIELQIFGHSNVKQSIEIDDKDVKLELLSRKLY